jgi:signal transduction histidine kinase
MGRDPRENGDGVVALTIPARAEYIALCRLALTGIARTRALQEEVVADLKLALTEACSNSVRHAYEEGRDGIVEVSYRLGEDRIVVEVTDDGAGFDPSATPRGSGLQGMADRLDAIGGTLEVRSQPGMGTTVTGRVPVPQGPA